MSQLKQIGAMTRLNIRLQLTDPAPTLILTVIPLVLIPFMMPAFKSMLLADGYTGVTGAEQAVPSIAIWTVCMRKATSALPVRMDACEVGEASRRSHVPHERSLKNEPMMFCTARNEKRIAIDGTACSAPVTPA